jgi:hypothetical protein
METAECQKSDRLKSGQVFTQPPLAISVLQLGHLLAFQSQNHRPTAKKGQVGQHLRDLTQRLPVIR